MKLTIELPDSVVEWLSFKAKQDFRSTEEMAAVIIRKGHRNEADKSRRVFADAVRGNQVSKPGDCACSSINEAR